MTSASVPACSLSMLAVFCALTGWMMASAAAQTVTTRDPAGNPITTLRPENGGRWLVTRDKAGDPLSHWVYEGNQWVLRNNAGDILARQNTRP